MDQKASIVQEGSFLLLLSLAFIKKVHLLEYKSAVQPLSHKYIITFEFIYIYIYKFLFNYLIYYTLHSRTVLISRAF